MKKFVAFAMAAMLAFAAIPVFAITEDDFVAIRTEEESLSVGEAFLEAFEVESTDFSVYAFCHVALTNGNAYAYIILDPTNKDSKSLTEAVDGKTILVDAFSSGEANIVVLASNHFSYMIFCNSKDDMMLLAVAAVTTIFPESGWDIYIPD